MMALGLRDQHTGFWANLSEQRCPFCRTYNVATLALNLLATLWLSGLARAQGKGSYVAGTQKTPSSGVSPVTPRQKRARQGPQVVTMGDLLTQPGNAQNPNLLKPFRSVDREALAHPRATGNFGL